MPLAYHAKKGHGPFKVQGTPSEINSRIQTDSPISGTVVNDGELPHQSQSSIHSSIETSQDTALSESIRSIQALAAACASDGSLKSSVTLRGHGSEAGVARTPVSRSLSNSGHDVDYPSFQDKNWQPDVDEAHELADRVYRSISSKSQQIIESSARITELERENGLLTERLRYETVMNGRAQQSKNEEIQGLKAKLEAITQAAAQLHAQQTAIIEEQRTKIEQLQQDCVQRNLASCSISRSPRDGARGRSEQQPIVQSIPSKVPTPLSNAPPASGLPDLPSRPRPSRRGRPASSIRSRAESSERQVAESSDRQAAPNPSKPIPDQLPPKRVLHSMNSPIRSALADASAPALPDAVESTSRTVVCA